MAAGIVIGGLGLVLAAVAGFAYLNKKEELRIAKSDIQYAHERLAQLESKVRQEVAGVVGAAKADVLALIGRVRSVFAKHLPKV